MFIQPHLGHKPPVQASASTTRVVDSGTKDARERYTRAATGIASSANYWWVESPFAVRTHCTASAPVVCTAATYTFHVVITTAKLTFLYNKNRKEKSGMFFGNKT